VLFCQRLPKLLRRCHRHLTVPQNIFRPKRLDIQCSYAWLQKFINPKKKLTFPVIIKSFIDFEKACTIFEDLLQLKKFRVP